MDFRSTDIRYVKGVGEARAKAFAKLGVTNFGELLEYFPRDYIDHRHTVSIAEAYEHIDENVTIIALIASPVSFHQIRKGMSVSKVRIADESATMQLTFFNNPYLKNIFHTGEQYLFYGKITRSGASVSMASPVFQPLGQGEIPALRPIYRLTGGITQKMIGSAVSALLPKVPEDFDPLPDYMIQRLGLCSYKEALEKIHCPTCPEDVATAKLRLNFSELFFYLLKLEMLRQEERRQSKFILNQYDNSFVKLNHFTPTNAQLRVIGEIRADFAGGYVMNRLLQGDVGSGKTFVAGDAAWNIMKDGHQAAIMAPTEILARQHYQYFAPLFEKLGKKCALLVGSLSAKAKNEIYKALADGSVDFVVGTHALIQNNVAFSALALVITDEQHRFGVLQRNDLSGKGRYPHILAMSATPIPRTMALILYGDLDISVIDELPAGRQKISTYLVNSGYEQRLRNFIQGQLADGGQVYYVCPLVEDSEMMDLTSVEAQTERLKQDFGQAVAMIHGKMKPKEKDAVMNAFVTGDIKILVSTTVIEVGINVPNATLMIIKDAERFGLSQLHQLRGRVGRGKKKSYCVLVSDSNSKTARHRMKFFCSTDDGFEIAREDLSMRGPGDLIGARQSGEDGALLIAENCDMRQVETAQKAARFVLERDPKLKLPEHAVLKTFLLEKFKETGDIYN